MSTAWPEFEHATYDEWEAARSRRPGGRVVWLVLVVVGVLVYELTAQPALAAVVACAKFGWEDLRTGWWLRRHALQPQGRVCSWFFFSAAFWRIAVTAVLGVFAIATLGAALEGARQARPLPNEVAGLLGVIGLESLAAFALSGFVTCIAVVTAARRGVRVWIDKGIHQARRDRTWPPVRWQGNRVPTLLFAASFVLPLPPILATVVAAATVAPFVGGVLAVVAMLFVWPVSLLCLRDMMLRRVVAHNPEQCWAYGMDHLH